MANSSVVDRRFYQVAPYGLSAIKLRMYYTSGGESEVAFVIKILSCSKSRRYPCPGERIKGTLGARLLCLVSSPHFARGLCLSGHVVRARFLCKSFHQDALTEKAWEDTVEGQRKGLLRTLRSCEYRVRFNLLALN